MILFSFSIVLILFIDGMLLKDLHVKEKFVLKENDNSISDLTNGYDDFADNERFVRHVELVTESVVEHLMKELKKRYPNSGYNNTSNILERLRMKLLRRVNKKRKLPKKKRIKITNGTNNLVLPKSNKE